MSGVGVGRRSRPSSSGRSTPTSCRRCSAEHAEVVARRPDDLAPLTLAVGDEAVTYRVAPGGVEVVDGVRSPRTHVRPVTRAPGATSPTSCAPPSGSGTPSWPTAWSAASTACPVGRPRCGPRGSDGTRPCPTSSRWAPGRAAGRPARREGFASRARRLHARTRWPRCGPRSPASPTLARPRRPALLVGPHRRWRRGLLPAALHRGAVGPDHRGRHRRRPPGRPARPDRGERAPGRRPLRRPERRHEAARASSRAWPTCPGTGTAASAATRSCAPSSTSASSWRPPGRDRPSRVPPGLARLGLVAP